MELDIEQILARMREAAAEAGDRIRADFAAPRDVRRKGRIDLVTATDMAVEAMLKERLGAIVPEAAILAEETASETAVSGLTWIIDPLDGTTNFAHGFPFVCTSIALYDGRQPLLGCINAPVLGQSFWAGRGLGAYCNGERLHVSDVDGLESALVVTGFPYAIRENLEEIQADMRRVLDATQGFRRPGSAALDLAYVAAGRCDAFYELDLHAWDVAAGILLVTEAGGVVSGYRPNTPYNLRDRRILATNGLLHDAMLHLFDA
jgi:myo-inositol-1(or 4)-monophosphatase